MYYLYDQFVKYLKKYLNTLLCCFPIAHSTQHALFKLSQSWQKELDKFDLVGTILKEN